MSPQPPCAGAAPAGLSSAADAYVRHSCCRCAVAHRRGRDAAQPVAQVCRRRTHRHDKHHLHVRACRSSRLDDQRAASLFGKNLRARGLTPFAPRVAATRSTWRVHAWRLRPKAWRKTWFRCSLRWRVTCPTAVSALAFGWASACACCGMLPRRTAAWRALRASCCALGPRERGTCSSRANPRSGCVPHRASFDARARSLQWRDPRKSGAFYAGLTPTLAGIIPYSVCAADTKCSTSVPAAHARHRRAPRGRRMRL